MNSQSVILNVCVGIISWQHVKSCKSDSCSIHTYTVYTYYILSLAIVFRNILKTLYIYIQYVYIHILKGGFFQHMLLPPHLLLELQRLKKIASRMWMLLYSAASLRESLEEMGVLGGGMPTKKTTMFSWWFLYLPLVIGNYWLFEKGPFFCVMMLSLSFWKSQWSIQMDRQHLANQLVWFIQRCLIVIHRRSKKSRYATTWFHQTIWGGSTVVSMLKVGQGLQFKS